MQSLFSSQQSDFGSRDKKNCFLHFSSTNCRKGYLLCNFITIIKEVLHFNGIRISPLIIGMYTDINGAVKNYIRFLIDPWWTISGWIISGQHMDNIWTISGWIRILQYLPNRYCTTLNLAKEKTWCSLEFFMDSLFIIVNSIIPLFYCFWWALYFNDAFLFRCVALGAIWMVERRSKTCLKS